MTENKVTKELPSEALKMVPIREVYDGETLPYSYTLKLDATIIDRKSKKELRELVGDRGLDVGRRLLTVHPSGGRLRISESGLVIGFEQERWVVIGSVCASEWFKLA